MGVKEPKLPVRGVARGSVSAGASFRIVRVRRIRLSCGLHDGECNLCRPGETGATERGGDNLVVTTAGAEEVAEFAMLTTEAAGIVMVLEAPHTSDPALDAAMILFKTIVEVHAGPVPHRPSQHRADRPGIGAMAIRRHPVGAKAHCRPGRAEEGLRCPHVALLAQHRVDQVAVPIDRPVEVAPPAAHLQVGFVNIPAHTGSASVPVTSFTQFIAHDGQQLCLPVPDGLIAHLEPPKRHDLTQVAQGQAVAQTAENHKADDVAGQAGSVQHAAAALIELPTALPAAKPPVALSRDLTTLRNPPRTTADTNHLKIRLILQPHSLPNPLLVAKPPVGARHDRTDEFVLLLSNPMSTDVLDNLTNHLTRIVARPVALADREVSVTCSLGYSVYPQDGEDATTLLKRADAAMYRAKQDGGNRMRQYTLGLSSYVVERLEAEIQLKLAVQRGEFVLHYQPQIEIGSGRIVGVEALARWQHPVHGLVPPAQFIPFAEETGMIEPIGEWVLRTACAQAAAWHRSGLPAMRMAINVSARQFHDPALVSMVAQVLAEHGLAPERLELEIIESMSMRDPEESCRILASFKALGISIAIDDFGTGYSNLAYLHQFPVSRIKLDRGFVSKLGPQSSSHAIVEAIVSMAHKLDLQVVAEGVETVEQRDQLLRYGCDVLQGYWFSRPVDAATFAGLLQENMTLVNFNQSMPPPLNVEHR